MYILRTYTFGAVSGGSIKVHGRLAEVRLHKRVHFNQQTCKETTHCFAVPQSAGEYKCLCKKIDFDVEAASEVGIKDPYLLLLVAKDSEWVRLAAFTPAS